MTKAAVWVRVSTTHQSTDNQIPDLEKFAAHHGYEIAKRYEVSDSAWNGGKPTGEYRATLKQAMDDAYRGEFEVLIVWALDRLTREGAEGLLRILREFHERKCIVVSVMESWLNTAPQIQDVMVSFAGWVAQQESTRRSDRIKLGLEKRKAAGMPVGRQVGARDKAKRRTDGYVEAWDRRRKV